MKKNNGIAVFVFSLFFILALSSQCLSQSETEKADFYRKSIEEQIAKCNAKIRFIDSKSQNLRHYCQLELQKAEFFSNAKEILLMEMIEKEIEAKDYKIQYFLNSRFYKAVLD
jgi:hypothetical protein